MTETIHIDASGLLCPWPIMRLMRAHRAAAKSVRFILRATDPMTKIDVAHYCSQHDLRLESVEETDDIFIFTIFYAARETI